jgi:hypothetical protein
MPEGRRSRAVPQNAVRLVERALKDWDPLAVLRGCNLPETEYDVHAPPIVALVAGGATVDEVAAHLGALRRDAFGAHEDDEQDRRIAVLIDLLLMP